MKLKERGGGGPRECGPENSSPYNRRESKLEHHFCRRILVATASTTRLYAVPTRAAFRPAGFHLSPSRDGYWPHPEITAISPSAYTRSPRIPFNYDAGGGRANIPAVSDTSWYLSTLVFCYKRGFNTLYIYMWSCMDMYVLMHGAFHVESAAHGPHPRRFRSFFNISKMIHWFFKKVILI